MKVKEWATKDHTLDLSNDMPDPEYDSRADNIVGPCGGGTLPLEGKTVTVSNDELRNKADEMANCEQYRKDTEEMKRLNQEWKEVFNKIKPF